jgi:hypothetical protein
MCHILSQGTENHPLAKLTDMARENWAVAFLTFRGNAYNGHTLKQIIEPRLKGKAENFINAILSTCGIRNLLRASPDFLPLYFIGFLFSGNADPSPCHYRKT